MEITLSDIESCLAEIFKKYGEPREIIIPCTTELKERIEEEMRKEIRRMNCETNN